MYKQIIEDLEFASGDGVLPTEISDGHANHWAAKTLLAKVYLTMASAKKAAKVEGYARIAESSEELYGKAYRLLGEIIDNSGRDLLPEYEDVFKIENKNTNKESIWEIQFSATEPYGTQWSKEMGLANAGYSQTAGGWRYCCLGGQYAINSIPSFRGYYKHWTYDKRKNWNVMDSLLRYNAETGEYLCDVTEDGQVVLLLKGGRGGLGNWNFRTATNQAPRYAQPGEPMQEMMVIMELKLLADVGLVGFPNAGKSTLLSAVSSARPKIANYPFTTLEPSLGIVSYRDNQSFVMADIPGIIEGASEGKGLGLRFLRHIERNSLLLFMVPGDTEDIRKEYEILLNELATFNPEMLDKQRVLAITKSDLLDEELIQMLSENLPDVPHVFISSVTGMGIAELKDVLWRELNSESNKLQAITDQSRIVHKNKDLNFLQNELKAMGEDEDIQFVDEEEIEDLDDFEYEEDWDDESQK